MTTLGALLLNPPLLGGARTVGQLHVVAELLKCDNVEIANLFAIGTRDITAINEVGQTITGWAAARSRLCEVIAASDQLLAGWGVSGLAGAAAQNQRAQLDYVRNCAEDIGKDYIWTLNGEPRHPSRWHQYVSDRHGRAVGATSGERIAMVLTSVPIAALVRRAAAAKRR